MFLQTLQNSLENTCAKVSYLIKLQVLPCNFIKKETLAQGFSFEFCEISKNTFFTEHVWTNASLDLHLIKHQIIPFWNIKEALNNNSKTWRLILPPNPTPTYFLLN